jgi:protein-S-isoprenylcysteine O-methyltransferase Ste14
LSLVQAHLLYALAWLAFGVVHSGLAASTLKDLFTGAPRAAWRLAYNVVAAAQLGAVWLVGGYVFADAPAYTLEPWAAAVLGAANVAGWVLFVFALRGYDLGRLAGTRQLRNHRRGIVEAEDEPLRRAGLNGFVRHPLYAAALLILWGRIGDPFDLATAIWGSLYILIGTFFEERRLARLYGADYVAYRRRVPAFVPWKGRAD